MLLLYIIPSVLALIISNSHDRYHPKPQGQVICDIDEQSLIVITVMYFDAYLKGRNHNPPSNHTINTSTQPQNKYSSFRPPNPQPNLINKPPTFNQIRIDHNKPNSSAHIFLSVAKNTNLPHKINNNNQARPQNNVNNLPGATFSRHQLTDDKKYICHSPVKIQNRTSAGVTYEQIPQSKFNYRRSESINDLTSTQSFQDSSVKNNLSTLRTTLEYHPSSDNRPLTSSPLQIKFNASNAYPNASNAYPNDKVGRVMKKQSIDSSRLLSNREQRCDYKDYIHSNTFRDSHYQSINQNKPYLNYQSNPSLDNFTSKQYEDIKYDFSLRKFDSEAKKTPQDPFKLNSYSSIPHAPLQFIKRQSSQQFLKRYGVSRLPELDKTLDKDIETLKLAHKKSQEVIEKEMSKNVYLNQLFEQKGPSKNNINDRRGNLDENPSVENKKCYLEDKRVSIQDRMTEHKGNLQQKKQLQAKCACLQKEIEERKNQLFQKNKELSQKSKSIIQKNKAIQSLVSQAKDLQSKCSSLQNNQVILNESVLNLKKDICNKSDRITQLQSMIKQREEQLKAQINKKCSIIEAMQAQFKERVSQLQKDIISYKENITNCNKLAKKKEQQYKENIVKVTQQINYLRQQSQRQKEQLILLHTNKIEEILLTMQKEIVRLQQQRVKIHDEKVSLQISNSQSRNQLLQQIKELRSCNKLLNQQIFLLKKEHQQINQSYQVITQQYLQIGQILQLSPNFKYEKLIIRIKQMLQPPLKVENALSKQIQRVQQEHLQRRHVQMNRQLKKVGSRLAGVSIEAQQGSRLLRDANSHIFLLNLTNLNEKYKYLLDQQQ